MGTILPCTQFKPVHSIPLISDEPLQYETLQYVLAGFSNCCCFGRRLFAVRPFVFGRPRQAGRRSSGASVLASVPDRRQSGVPDGQIAAPFPIGFVGIPDVSRRNGTGG